MTTGTSSADGQQPVQGSTASQPDGTPQQPAALQVTNVTMTSDQLKARFDEERTKGEKAFLKELGFDSKKDAQALVSFARKTQDDAKTELDRAKSEVESYKSKAEKADTYKERFEKIVNARFDALPEKMRAAIDDVAQGDADARDRLITTFEKHDLIGSASAATKVAGPAKPADAGSTSPAPPNAGKPSIFDQWTELQRTSSGKAAIFYANNSNAIEKARPAASG